MPDLCPYAWLLTWTTYGTWLHGDERGSWDRKAEEPFPRFVQPNIRLQALRRGQLKHEPLLITPAMRKVVREAIEQDCTFRRRRLYALNVRTNHVHAVIVNSDQPARLMHAMKARATRMLRQARLIEADRPAWTAGGSHKWLLNEEEVTLAISYVNNMQGDPLPEA